MLPAAPINRYQPLEISLWSQCIWFCLLYPTLRSTESKTVYFSHGPDPINGKTSTWIVRIMEKKEEMSPNGYSSYDDLIHVTRHLCTSVKIGIGNSLICSDIWHKNHECYFEIVIRHMWIEFVVGSLPCSKRFSPVRTPPFSLLKNQHFQFDLERTDKFKRPHMNSYLLRG